MAKPRKPIHLDNAATTFERPEVSETVREWAGCANAMSLQHSAGRAAAGAVETARERVARLINASPSEVFFTSGATEANNWVLAGWCDNHLKPSPAGKQGSYDNPCAILSPATEHHSVTETVRALSAHGRAEPRTIEVDGEGLVWPDALEAAVRHRRCTGTPLASVMRVNNETGALQDIKTLAAAAHRHGAWFHCDATAAVGKIKVDVRDLNVDFLSLSAHKFHGPKGVGALYIRSGTRLLSRWMNGGGQESGLRAGTCNVPGIAGMGVAARIVERDGPGRAASLDGFLHRLSEALPGVRVLSPEEGVSCIASVSFADVDGEAVATYLDGVYGVQIGVGAACASAGRSHVLEAMEVPEPVLRGAVRFSTSFATTPGELDQAAQAVVETVMKLRRMNP